MKIKLLMSVIILLFLVNIAFVAADQQFDITNNINQANSEIVVPQGENAVASLPLFSRTYLRLYEGTKLDFNVVDPDNGVTLIKNSMIVKEIDPKSTKLLVSLDGKPYEEMTILLGGKDTQLNYTYKFMPFMLVKEMINHYDQDPKNRNAVFYFNIPFLKTGKTLDAKTVPNAGSAVLDTSNVKSGNNSNGGMDLTILTMVIIVGILILVIIYIKKIKQ